jgi:glycosyltransferase involved in cell wall biosynthesis
MKKLNIAILGTRGIPNNYGGYEQAATFLSVGLLQKGHTVTVYNSHNHPYRENKWNGVEIIHCYDPEYKTGTAGQFIYDLNCIRDARKKNYDVILFMGYTSNSVWAKFYPPQAVIISHMDGLEWQRSKYSMPVRRFLRYAEKLAVKHSDFYITDSPGIQKYLQEKYNISSRYISYGATIYNSECKDVLNSFGLSPNNYYLAIARIEPENNIETILNGFLESGSDKKFIVVGNANTRYGKELQKKFSRAKQILFAGSLFDQQKLHSLRAFCSLYFHGHSVGGTNPSLLEAMAGKALIVAHDNLFNKNVLGNDAYFFSFAGDIKNIIHTVKKIETEEQMTRNNLEKIKNHYSWEKIIDQYENFILQCHNEKVS